MNHSLQLVNLQSKISTSRKEMFCFHWSKVISPQFLERKVKMPPELSLPGLLPSPDLKAVSYLSLSSHNVEAASTLWPCFTFRSGLSPRRRNPYLAAPEETGHPLPPPPSKQVHVHHSLGQNKRRPKTTRTGWPIKAKGREVEDNNLSNSELERECPDLVLFPRQASIMRLMFHFGGTCFSKCDAVFVCFSPVDCCHQRRIRNTKNGWQMDGQIGKSRGDRCRQNRRCCDCNDVFCFVPLHCPLPSSTHKHNLFFLTVFWRYFVVISYFSLTGK